MFRASLSRDVTAFAIAEWLKNAPLENVTSVRIEAVVLYARDLQALNLFSRMHIQQAVTCSKGRIRPRLSNTKHHFRHLHTASQRAIKSRRQRGDSKGTAKYRGTDNGRVCSCRNASPDSVAT